MKMKDLLRAFQKNKASRTYLVRGEGYENQGIAADIPKNKASMTYSLGGKGYENKETAADSSYK